MRKIKLNVLFSIAIIFIVLGCKKEMINENRFIQNLSNDIDFELPMVNESLLIFVKKNDRIFITRLRQLYSLKQKKYNEFNDFDDFLIEVINNDLLSKEELESISRNNSFKVNDNIKDEFKKNGINYLREHYCNPSKVKDKFYLKNNLELNIQQNLMYIFFKNNYYVMQNDDSGNYVLIDKNI